MMVAGSPDNSVDRIARTAKEPLEKSIEAGYQIISALGSATVALTFRNIGLSPSMHFRIHCQLAYDILGAASFLFNVAATRNACQTLITESLELSGADSCEELLLGRQRFHWVFAKKAARACLPSCSRYQAPSTPTRWIGHSALA